MVETGKTDMDRIGLFHEMGYISIGDNFKDAGHVEFNENAGKGKQLLSGGHKFKAGNQIGYFTDKFQRVMEGESYTDPVKNKRQQKLQSKKKNISSKAFMPTDGYKEQNGQGTHYGTIGGKIEYFPAISRDQHEAAENRKNLYTTPGKQGTGYGYIDVTISKYHKYMSDTYGHDQDLKRLEAKQNKSKMKGSSFRLNMHPQAFFHQNPYAGDSLAITRPSKDLPFKGAPFVPSHPGKKSGGLKAGTFNAYPKHSEDSYLPPKNKVVNIVNKYGKTYYPPMGSKSKPQHSIVNQMVTRSMNAQNYRSISGPITIR